jgi:hypothetical protein
MPLILHEPQRRPPFLACALFLPLEVYPDGGKSLLPHMNQPSFKRYPVFFCPMHHRIHPNTSHPTQPLLSVAAIEYP